MSVSIIQGEKSSQVLVAATQVGEFYVVPDGLLLVLKVTANAIDYFINVNTGLEEVVTSTFVYASDTSVVSNNVTV